MTVFTTISEWNMSKCGMTCISWQNAARTECFLYLKLCCHLIKHMKKLKVEITLRSIFTCLVTVLFQICTTSNMNMLFQTYMTFLLKQWRRHLVEGLGETKMGSHWFLFKTSCESRTIMEQNKPNCAIKILYVFETTLHLFLFNCIHSTQFLYIHYSHLIFYDQCVIVAFSVYWELVTPKHIPCMCKHGNKALTSKEIMTILVLGDYVLPATKLH